MASPQRNKVSVFTETAYGTPQVATGGVAYQTTNDGSPTAITGHIAGDGMYAGQQAMVDENIRTVIKGWNLSFTKYLKTHGDERWLRDAVGTHETATTQAVAAAGGQPATYNKIYKTDDVGPDDSYTVVLDRFAFLTAGGGNLGIATFAGCMDQGWGFSVTEDNAIELTRDLVARSAADTTGTVNTTAAYATATVGSPVDYGWDDSSVKFGDAGAVPTEVIGDLQDFSYTQANNLVLKWDIDGDALMRKPYMANGGITGTINATFNLSDETTTEIWDKFLNGTLVAVQFEATRTPYSFRVYIPSVHLETATRSGTQDDVTQLTVTGNVRWAPTTDAVTVTYATEGNTNT